MAHDAEQHSSIPALLAATLLAPLASEPPTTSACTDVVGVDEIVAPGNVVLVGEVHGTMESPAFVADVACHALAGDLAVTIGLEMPTSEQRGIDVFVESEGDDADVAALLDGPFWTEEPLDGRTSAAMLELLQDIRRARLGGAAIEVVAIDPGNPGGRDAAMAQAVVDAAEGRPDGLVVALTGNVHAATVAAPAAADSQRPMGAYVADALGDDRVIALDIGFGGGTAWVVLEDGTVGKVSFGDVAEEPDAVASTIIDLSSSMAIGFDGRYDVGNIHASAPAIDASS